MYRTNPNLFLTKHVLKPWVEAARAIGHDELTQAMQNALREAEGEVARTLEALSNLEG